MALKFVISEVNIENVVKGKNRWSVANVAYTWNGQARSQKIVSFSNPAIFDIIKGLNPGDKINVETDKNAEGFTYWKSVDKDAGGDAPAPSAVGGKVTGSNYETKEERARRQVVIVKQSSLQRAIDYLGGANTGSTRDEIIDTAQFFADWVLDDTTSLVDMPDDIPQ